MRFERDFEKQRQQMVAHQIRNRGIRDEAILNAMLTIPREAFVPARFQAAAYDDTPLPIPAGQTISQPYVVAVMIRAMQIEPADRVLEVGSGSGYAAALLGQIAEEVHAIERHAELVAYAKERLAALGYDNVHVHHSDGTLGWPDAAPYDAIMVSAGGPEVPPALQKQLAIGGRVVIPIGSGRGMQRLIRQTRQSAEEFSTTDMGHVRFVPLIGEQGWNQDQQ